MSRMVRILLASVIVVTTLAVPTGQPVQAAPTAQNAPQDPNAPQDTPVTLVDGGVSTYTMANPKLFWRTGILQCPPGAPGEGTEAGSAPAPAESAATDATQTETIKRIATYGGQIRTVWSEVRNCSQGRIESNLGVDADYIYWLEDTGLYRISTSANPGDTPELVNALARAPGEVVDGGDRVFLIYTEVAGEHNRKIGYVRKDNKQLVPVSTPGNTANNLSYDGANIYYMVGGALVRLKPDVNSGEAIVLSGVTGYYAEGSRFSHCTITPPQCFFSNSVYVAKGKQIFVYNNNTNTLGNAIYTSTYPLATSIVDLVTDFSRLFFIERRDVPCGLENCFIEHIDAFMRKDRFGGAASPIHTNGPTVFDDNANLNTDGSFLFWDQGGDLLRLPNDAAALPVVNMKVTGMEITQGIQNPSNSVLLVKKRRTFVRVYVKSDGPGSVSGVTAYLRSQDFEFAAPLVPVNTTGTQITVRTNPNRDDIEQSFLFELPWGWTNRASLRLTAEINPNQIPLEPNYNDNFASRTVNFKNSPTLSVEFFRLNFTLGGTTYRPRISEDILRTYSWILRAYPIGGAVGENFKPRLWDVDGGTQLGNWVNTSSGDCDDVYGNPGDDISLCASYYTNGWLFYYRVATMFGLLNVGLNANAFYYGMIADGSSNFPRGQAVYSQTSVGPSGTPCSPFNLGCGWDTDGTYADWYAGHEIGHSLGRAHPIAGSDDPNTGAAELCRHSRSDLNYPYGDTSTAAAPIGPANGSIEGFDVGDPAYNIPRAVLPSNIWNDLMSYCSNQWISDYTYTAMYNYMIANPSAAQANEFGAPAVTGDFLVVSGLIDPDADSASFGLLRRLDNVTNIPPRVPGDYAIRLLDADNAQLAKYPFTPEPLDDAPDLGFSQVVTYSAGTRTVQIVHTETNEPLVAAAISANAPVVSDVALQGALNPVTGTVTLKWKAADADGDAMTYDIAYSRDNGVTFQPIASNVMQKTAQIDTAQLGGSGTAILRVIASDGVNTGYADSAPFVMAAKPPQPVILSPADEYHIHWGQLVNFNGMALDAQDGLIPDSGLVWRNAAGKSLGAGALISRDNLPVGVNEIRLIATNSAGLSAESSVTVIVDDDLNHPGPTLSVGPTQIGWQVPNGATTAQNAQLLINNAGSGSLAWTASENQPWLTLDVVTGTVTAGGDPVAITLTANPSGLEGDQTYLAELTITKPASGEQPAQSIVVPVTLSIGDVRNEAPKAPPPITQSLAVEKVVVGGPLNADDFPLFIDGAPVVRGEAEQLEAGAHTVSETSVSTYTATFGGACNAGGAVNLAEGTDVTCTITNTYVNPPGQGGVHGFVFEDKNDNGRRDGGEGVAEVEVTLNSNAAVDAALTRTTNTDASGAYSFSELPPGGYSLHYALPATYNPHDDVPVTVVAGQMVGVPAVEAIKKEEEGVSSNVYLPNIQR